jgi:hypothetical protein
MNQVHPLEQAWELRKSEHTVRLRASKEQKQELLLINDEAQRMVGGPPSAVDIRYEQPEEKDWAVVKLYMAEQYDQYDLYLNNADIAFFVLWSVGWGLFAIAAYVAYLFFARWRLRGLVRSHLLFRHLSPSLWVWCVSPVPFALLAQRRGERMPSGAKERWRPS